MTCWICRWTVNCHCEDKPRLSWKRVWCRNQFFPSHFRRPFQMATNTKNPSQALVVGLKAILLPYKDSLRDLTLAQRDKQNVYSTRFCWAWYNRSTSFSIRTRRIKGARARCISNEDRQCVQFFFNTQQRINNPLRCWSNDISIKR